MVRKNEAFTSLYIEGGIGEVSGVLLLIALHAPNKPVFRHRFYKDGR